MVRTKCSIAKRIIRVQASVNSSDSGSFNQTFNMAERERATNQKAENRNAIDGPDAQTISWKGQAFARDFWIGCIFLSPLTSHRMYF